MHDRWELHVSNEIEMNVSSKLESRLSATAGSYRLLD